MSFDRRDFLKGAAWMCATAAVAGCKNNMARFSMPGTMSSYADKPLSKVRVAVAGLGHRGRAAVHRLASIPGVEIVALCDLHKNLVDEQNEWLKSQAKPEAKSFYVYLAGNESGKDETAAYKAMCETEADLVYITTSWQTHAPIALYAMEHGKHAAIEVPAAMTIEDCWALIETSERTKRHCMQLENCCYGEIEMLSLNLVRKGILGEIMHAEGAYIHDLRSMMYAERKDGGYESYWRLKWNAKHNGNCYPTHGLVPLMQSMNINRGDRFDYLTCVATNQVGMDLYAKGKFGAGSWQAKVHPKRGDMSTTLIRTVNGKTIMIQHDVTSPRPYSRINLLSGTKGLIKDYPYRIALETTPGEGAHGWMKKDDARQFRIENRHPLWKDAGEIAKKVGGHGGMDFLMDLRLCYCLQNGLPLDMDVYDLATSCSLCELTERSLRDRSNSVDVPDFTRGAWETTPPLGIVSIDISKLDFKSVKSDSSQLNV